jgi:hypothetical protein
VATAESQSAWPVLAYSYRNLGRRGVAFVPIQGLTSMLRVVWSLDNTTPTLAWFLVSVRENMAAS